MTTTAPTPTRIGPSTFVWGERTFVMGILNVTPDSFSGDGLLRRGDPVAAVVEQARERGGPVVVAGSLYLVGTVRGHLVDDPELRDPAVPLS